MQFYGLGAIDDVKAEADLGAVFAAQGQAQVLVLQVQDRSSADAKRLVARLEALTAEANVLAATRADSDEATWNAGVDVLLLEFDQLRVDAAVVLEEQHKKTQFRGALVGASIVAVGAAGLFWALRKRKKR
jgi:hypothetical protein